MKNAGAQSYVLSTVSGEGIDSVTVRSRMGYRITPDSIIVSLVEVGIMNPSIYNWSFSDGTTVLNPDGSTAIAVGGFYADTAISAVIGNTLGIISVSVAEQSVPMAGTGCTGGTQTLLIQVLPRPTIYYFPPGLLQAKGACAVENYSLPLSLSGYGPWSVDYTITFNAGAPVAYNQVIGSVGNNVGTTPINSLTLDIDTTQLANGVGTYLVQITNVRDRISLKSLDSTLIQAHPADLPTVDSFMLYVYPTPVNINTIKHIKNW